MLDRAEDGIVHSCEGPEKSFEYGIAEGDTDGESSGRIGKDLQSRRRDT